MATYPPPTYTEPLNIFNPIYFENDTTLLTIDYANKHYLKYPVAQGLETLQQIIVNGTATMNDSVEIQTNYGSSALRSLTISDNTTNQGLDIRPNANNTNNPSVVSGEIVVETLGTQNAETLTLTTTSTNYSAVKIASNSVSIGAGGNTSTPTTSVSVNGSNGLVSINGIDLSFNTTNPPTCNASSTIVLSDDSNKLPSTAWVRDYVASAIPTPPITFVSTASTTGYNAGGNYTYWYFTSYPTWSAYSWVFNTPTTSRTNVNKTNLGSSPPLNVGTIGANGSFLYMTGNGISQGYTATSSTMITYCAGFQQQYTISAGATASILSIINCIGGTPASPIFQSNQLTENNGTCPPTAFGLSGYIILQMLNGNYTGLGTPKITFTQIIP